MYTTKADDLARIANDLNSIAKKYTDGSQHLEQQIAGLDGTASHLIYGGSAQWVGVSSEAFQGVWDERRTRMQQASQLLSQGAQHLTQFAQTIEDNLSTIRADQSFLQSTTTHIAGRFDQQEVMDEESQAQNAIVTALAALNSQLEMLAEEVRDCPEEQDEKLPAYGNDPYNGINRSDSNADAQGKKGDSGSKEGSGDTAPPRVTPEGRLLTGHSEESLPRHKMTPQQVDDVIDNYSSKTTQRDGATVYIKKQPGRGRNYSLVIEGDGGIVTAMRDLEPRELGNLGRRYGFNYTP